MEISSVQHPIPPLYNASCKILILGSFPSVKSRESAFFYGHPQNRFWRVMAALTGKALPVTVDEKKDLVLGHGIALWDVIASCDIAGSSDASIRNAKPTDLSPIFASADIRAVFCNGGTAAALYKKYQQKQTGIEAAALPSTSPANAGTGLAKLIEIWGDALSPYLF